jgi:NADPH:quinone reductase
MQAIILDKIGDVKSLKIKEIEDPKKFGKDDVLIKHSAIGINFFDIAIRRGQYKFAKTPEILGFEACGIVEAIGSNVKEFSVGQRVAYATAPIGAYCQKRVVNKNFLVIVPDNITDSQAAASLYKGLMAHTLLFRAYIAKRAKKILVHSAAGGVGQFLCQWSKSLGLEVFGCVGNQEKVNFALENGCKAVINTSKTDFLEEIKKLTNNQGVGAVYDGVGKDTIAKSLKSLSNMGICLNYGESSGNAEKLDLNLLVLNSLYLTRPTLALYKSNRIELALAASDIFDLIAKKILRPKITEYDFKDVQKAHFDLESRKSIGSLILKL